VPTEYGVRLHWDPNTEPDLARHTVYRGEVYEDDYGWYYRLSGSVICEERFTSCERARKALLKLVDGDPVNSWD